MTRTRNGYLAANDLLHEGNPRVVETRQQLRLPENHLDLVLLVVTAREKENAVVDRLQIDDLRRVHGPRAALATQTHLPEGSLPQDSFQCVLFLDPVESVRKERSLKSLLGDKGVCYPKGNRRVLEDVGM